MDEHDLRVLVVNDAEADALRTIFRESLAPGSVPALRKRLATLGIVNKRRTDRYGRVTGGCAFSFGALYHLLRNPVYAGRVKHRDTEHESLHAAIIDAATWQRAQGLLDGNGGGPNEGQRKQAARWLDGRLFDPYNRPMRTTYTMRSIRMGSVRQSKRYWYYVSEPDDVEDQRTRDRLPAAPLEVVVREATLSQLAKRGWLADALSAAGIDPDAMTKALACAAAIAASAGKRFDDDGSESTKRS